MTADLFAFAAEKEADAGRPAKRLTRPSREKLESRAFGRAVSDMLTAAMRKDLFGAALASVRRRLAETEGLDVSERELAAVNHRYWAGISRRTVPTIAEAMKRVGTYDVVSM